METLILILIAVIGVVLAVQAVMKPILDDEKVRGKVLNFSEGMRDYHFLLAAGKEETEAALAEPLEQEVVAYRFLPESGSIRFSRENTEADYALRFYERDGKHYLRVTRVAEEREKGNIPYLVNAFFVKNLRAKPVDYRQFRALFPEDED